MKIGVGVYWEKFNSHRAFYMDHYDCIEIQDFIMPDNLDSNRQRRVNQYGEALRNYQGLRTIHGPYIDLEPISFDPYIQEASCNRYKQCLEVAAELDCGIMVIHSSYDPIKSYGGYEEYFLEENIKFWKTLIKAFEEKKILAVIENVHDSNYKLIKSIVEQINSPYLGACLDTGHAHALVKTDVLDWLEGYRSYLKYIHINDNNGELDQHLPIGEGNINFKAFFERLKEIGYRGIVTNEISGGRTEQERNLEQLRRYLNN
ncbi:MAG: sugar phosphate isomerase/epimerase family protein [Thermotaleaceae bacterium]